MVTVKVICDYCDKEFERPSGRYNEAVKFGWKQFCSTECQSQSKTKKILKIAITLYVKNHFYPMSLRAILIVQEIVALPTTTR